VAADIGTSSSWWNGEMGAVVIRIKRLRGRSHRQIRDPMGHDRKIEPTQNNSKSLFQGSKSSGETSRRLA
jgi:hypothetical protein